MILFAIVSLIALYTIISYIGRKVVKPNYKGQVVWITGASSGIGEYLAY